MKKLLAGILTLTMVGTFCASSASATQQTANLSVTVQKNITYTVTIPESMTLTDLRAEYAVSKDLGSKASVTPANLNSNEKVNLFINSGNTYNLKSDENVDVPYGIYDGASGETAYTADQKIVEATINGTATETVNNLYFKISDTQCADLEPGATYADVLTFTATVTTAATQF